MFRSTTRKNTTLFKRSMQKTTAQSKIPEKEKTSRKDTTLFQKYLHPNTAQNKIPDRKEILQQQKKEFMHDIS